MKILEQIGALIGEKIALVYEKLKAHTAEKTIHRTSAEIRAEIVEQDIPAGIARVADVTRQLQTKADAAALQAHAADTANPHAITKSQVGLGNADNTADLAKPLSTATRQALDNLSGNLSAHTENHAIHRTSAEIRAEITDQDIPSTIARDAAVDKKILVHDENGDAHPGLLNSISNIGNGTILAGRSEYAQKLGDAQGSYTKAQLDVKLDTLIHNVTYDAATAKFTFHFAGGRVVEIDTPLENTVKDGHYDTVTAELVLVLISGQEIRIPAAGLTKIYTGKTTATTATSVNASGEISADLRVGAVEMVHLSAALQQAIGGQQQNGDTKDCITTFADQPRSNLASGDKHSVLFGKIKRWFSDLGVMAFRDNVSKTDLTDTLQGEINGKCDTTDPRLSDARPANGGNADTSNRLLLSVDRPIYGNGMIINQHSNFSDAPEPNVCFSYMRILHENQAGYFSEIATPFTDSKRMYFRNMEAGYVNPWNAVAYLTDIPTTLPANGGNADTVSGSPAWRLQSVDKNRSPYGADIYDLQSRFDAKGDGKFRLEIVSGSEDIVFKDSVSVGHADQANNADTLDGLHADNFLASTNGVHIGALRINPTDSGYAEGIRISRFGGWANVQFGVDPNEATGRIDNQWIIGSNPAGAFSICLAGTESGGGIPTNGFGLSPNNEGAYFNRKRIATIDDIPTTLPANGGNADTVSGSPAWRLQSVKVDGVLFGANTFDIQSRFNAKGDARFRLEVVGSTDVSIYTDSVSVGHADQANNADTVDGLHAAAVGQVEANKLASYNANGFMNARLFRDNWGVDNALPIGFVCFKTTLEDGYHLFCSLERFKQVLGTFITNRGSLGVDELNTFTNRESGTYSVQFPNASQTLIVFKSTGSASSIEILSSFEEYARLQVRKTIDSNRQTNFKELAWLTDIPTNFVTTDTTQTISGAKTFAAYCDFPAGAGNSGSDMRFKKHIAPVGSVLQDLLSLHIIQYTWDKSGETQRDTFGLSASQLIEKGGVFQKTVHERPDDEKTKWVEYDRIGVLAVKAIQELHQATTQETAALKQEIADLRQQLSQLRETIVNLKTNL